MMPVVTVIAGGFVVGAVGLLTVSALILLVTDEAQR